MRVIFLSAHVAKTNTTIYSLTLFVEDAKDPRLMFRIRLSEHEDTVFTCGLCARHLQ